MLLIKKEIWLNILILFSVDIHLFGCCGIMEPPMEDESSTAEAKPQWGFNCNVYHL